MVAIQDLLWHNIWLADNTGEVLNEYMYVLVGRYVPSKVIRVRNKDKPWFDDQCRQEVNLGELVFVLGLAGKSLFAVK